MRVERDEVFLELTRSICPLCKRVVDAEVNIRENKVVLRKRCPEHGPFEALVYSDAELYMSQLRFNKPGTARTPDRSRCFCGRAGSTPSSSSCRRSRRRAL